MEKYDKLFGFESIEYLVADREFIGEKCLEYLNGNHIKYHIRIRDNFKVFKTINGKSLRSEWFFTALKLGEFAHHSKI